MLALIDIVVDKNSLFSAVAGEDIAPLEKILINKDGVAYKCFNDLPVFLFSYDSVKAGDKFNYFAYAVKKC